MIGHALFLMVVAESLMNKLKSGGVFGISEYAKFSLKEESDFKHIFHSFYSAYSLNSLSCYSLYMM